MTLRFDGDYYELSWRDLREVMEQNETYSSQLLADRENVRELRYELSAERPDLAGSLDNIAADWTGIRWRLASIVLLERVPDLDRFCTAAHGSMAGDTEAIKRLVKLLKGVDAVERAHWENRNVEAGSSKPKGGDGGEAGQPDRCQWYSAGYTTKITLPGGATMRLVWCPATTSDAWKRISGGKDYFMMGSPASEEGRCRDEIQHRVTLTKGFWLGRHEVTQRQWRSVMGSNPSYFRGDDLPVEKVSWDDCQEFIRKVNASLTCGVRLPTEAEWEYACRAGTTGAYAGDLSEMAWYESNSGGMTHDVGTKRANAWGLCNMHGNVLEWCNDRYGAYGGVVTDTSGPITGSFRVLRGGCWNNYARNCRSAKRYFGGSSSGNEYSGFRLACSAWAGE